MIGRLRGIISKTTPLVLLETAGVGYEVHMPMTSMSAGGRAGGDRLHHFVVREDAQLLYGFNNKQERTLFKELIKPTAGPSWRWRSSPACRRSSSSTPLNGKRSPRW